MHEELEMLRKEVIDLKRQKEEAISEAQKMNVSKEVKNKESRESTIKKIKENAAHAEENLHENLSELIETVKNEYNTLSPVAAVLLFALGASFGRAISSK